MQFSPRHAFTVGFCTAILLTVVSCKSAPKKEATASTTVTGTLKPLNVVFITLDTVRADHLHCYGYKNIQTPNVDALAARGIIFDKAVTQTPLTLPSHASMFTGLNPNVHQVRNTGGFSLQPQFVTLATILQKRGWNTAAFISASVLGKAFGFSQGFSVYDDQAMEHALDNGEPIETRRASDTVDRALSWLNSQSTQPFFLWVHFYDAHQPYHPPQQFSRQYPNNPYDAEIAYTDQQLGRLLNEIRKKSSDANTLYVLLTDHGESLGDHGEYNHGVFLYDSTVRIAWIIAGPGVPAGIRIPQQARTIDVQPTILDLLGGKAASNIQGVSLVPSFSGKPVDTRYSYEETLYPKINMDWSELRGIHTAHWVYVHAPKSELYDLDNDPAELHNVIDTHPKEYRELEQQLKVLSRLGNDGKESVVSQQMDQKTMAQLKSLGYAGGEGRHQYELNGEGTDPKDRTGILNTINLVNGPDAEKLSSTRKVELLQQGIAAYPTDPSLYYTLGDEFQKMNRPDLALASTLDALHHGVRSAMLYSRLGDLYLAKGDLPQAIDSFQKVTQYNPFDVGAQTGLANAYANSGQSALAERTFQQVLVIQQYAPAYSGLGLLAVKRQDFAAARNDFQKAVQLDPAYPDGQLNLGVLCMNTHDIPCARTAFNAFLAIASPDKYRDMIPKVHNALNTVLAQN